MGDEHPSPTYLDDAAPAGQAAGFALPGKGAGDWAGGRSESHAAGSLRGAGPSFISGHAEAAVSVGNPAAVIARLPVSEATSPAATAAAFAGSSFQGALGAEGRARGGGQGPASGAPPAALRHGRPATRQHKAASPRPRVPAAAASGRRARPLLRASSRCRRRRLGRFFRFFFFFFNLDVMFVSSSPCARLKSWRQNYRKIPAGERRERHKSAPAAAEPGLPAPGEGKHAPAHALARAPKITLAGRAPTRGPPGAHLRGYSTRPKVPRRLTLGLGAPSPGAHSTHPGGRSTHHAGTGRPDPEPGCPPRAESKEKR